MHKITMDDGAGQVFNPIPWADLMGAILRLPPSEIPEKDRLALYRLAGKFYRRALGQPG